MRVLVACEFSGVVRDAFTSFGHEAMSCDLLPTETFGEHYEGDVLDIIDHGWDLMIAHPPCTYLCVSGNSWSGDTIKAKYLYPNRKSDRDKAVNFFMQLANADIPKICIENPIGIMSTIYRQPDQIIHPYEFGHVENKATCLWLKDLPKLVPTSSKDIIRTHSERERLANLPKGPERAKERSRTFQGIADAMVRQWGW